MIKKIALTWFKRTWKDYIANTFFSDFQIYRIADGIKLTCVKDICKTPSTDFLLNDDKLYFDYLSRENKKSELDTSLVNKASLSLSNSQILEKVNLYKTINWLSTREAIYSYLDIQDQKWYDFWSKKMIEDIWENQKSVIVTDCRMIIEAIDLLLSDFFILNVYNSRSLDLKKNLPNALLHSTELQLGFLVDEWIWFSLDISSRDQDYLESIISEVTNTFFDWFTWYTQSFKESLIEFRQEVLESIPHIESQIDKFYKEKNTNMYTLYKNKLTVIQNRLRELVKEEYQKHLIF